MQRGIDNISFFISFFEYKNTTLYHKVIFEVNVVVQVQIFITEYEDERLFSIRMSGITSSQERENCSL